jgi:hypothetical protein
MSRPHEDLHFVAAFTEEIQPFIINVDEDFLRQTRLKVSLTRLVETELADQDVFVDGPPGTFAKQVKKYWETTYDWRKVESALNQQFRQFTTTVRTGPKSFLADPVPLHFVHHKPERSDAIPLLFIHGWPGSFLEAENIIHQLTDPPAGCSPAFHVVVPSIPGYGFSPSPRRPGMGYREVGHCFHALMTKLGYSMYVIQGGDAGDFILRYQASDYPENVISALSNFWIIPPNDKDKDRYHKGESTSDERHIIELLGKFETQFWAYGHLHQTRPLRLAWGLTDSPLGLAMWIYDSVAGVVVDPIVWTPERLITWTMMHWIPGPYAAFSLYKHGSKVGWFSKQRS